MIRSQFNTLVTGWALDFSPYLLVSEPAGYGIQGIITFTTELFYFLVSQEEDLPSRIKKRYDHRNGDGATYFGF